MGDDAHARPRRAQGADRRGPRELAPLAVAGPAEVDDHHVAVADVGEHLQRALTVLGLLDLVSLAEQPAHPHADHRVVVDD